MSKQRRCLAGSLVVASLLLGACGSAEQESAVKEPQPAQDHALAEMTDTMDEARAVEDLTRGRNEVLDRTLEETETVTPPADR